MQYYLIMNNYMNRDLGLGDADGKGNMNIRVYIRDKVSGAIVDCRLIKRATLAKAMQPNSGTMITALNGLFVIEI